AIESTINGLTDRWNEVYPDEPLDVRFLDQTIAGFYQNERRMSRVSSLATVISILISCLGLFGLMSYNVIQKSKELGIRKVLGASVKGLTFMMNKSFVLLVVVAFIIATPLVWYAMNDWLQNFAYTIDLSICIFLSAAIVSMLIAWLTVSSQAYRAASINPVKSLKNE
ncbi:MAG: FtsX-like permease family protein, partial [Bacteroidota bacterium]